ncbi:hypothetical protein [Thermoactinomyces sp. CICC 10522]|uniref:hypothetical protein n=1 Tax=Thermoactinomyces sp. CICC 10522 TaxID=2767427 RepID=UPI0018DBF3B8|nr:hypothetical protein [Thermoactinomyces sp. CICC 10522]MBH8605600.1 hypothetical protein [Thermoactinomyces sp. CICC 10522]
MGKKREVGSIWRAIFGDGEETQAQKDARALSRFSSNYKSRDYEKYIKPREEARRKRWEEAEKQQLSYFSDPPDISEEEYRTKIDEAMSFFSPGWGDDDDDGNNDNDNNGSGFGGFGW